MPLPILPSLPCIPEPPSEPPLLDPDRAGVGDQEGPGAGPARDAAFGNLEGS